MSKRVAATEFDAHTLELLEEMVETREEVLIIRDGHPIARMVPVPRPMTISDLRRLGGQVTGDIITPIDEWDMTK